MIEILKKALKNKNIISLCVGKIDWNKRVIGYVNSVNETAVVIEMVDIFGSIVKNKSIPIKSISVVEINDSYNKHLEKLKKHEKAIKKINPLYYFNKGNNFNEKLEKLLLEKNICTVFFGTEFITGVIQNFNEDDLCINAIGYRGTKEGEVYCRLVNVTKIRYEGPLEEKISYLQNL
ncbi:MAG: hypothetical protein WKF88_07760 [Ferruginibacter sp.]